MEQFQILIQLDIKWHHKQLEQHFKFSKNNAKLYVPIVTLSINYNIRFLESVKQGFKRRISCNKYRSKIKTQPKDNNKSD